MSTRIYRNALNPNATPQSEPIPGSNQVANSAGGFSFPVDVWTRLDRFLILGTEGGSYYATEQKLTADNAKSLVKAIEADGVRVVNRIVEISETGRAPKNDPALYALALVMTYGDKAAQNAACDAIPKVARIGTHILHLADYVNGLRGWGRGVRRGFANWYNGKQPLALAKQMTKYANRDGWTHKDILRLAHVKPVTPTHDALFTDAVGKAKAVEIDTNVAEYMSAVEELKRLTKNEAKRAVKLITDFELPREVVPTELLNTPEVWAALLPHMGLEALVRNLATLTRVGIIAPLSDGQKLVIEKLTNEEAVKKSRIHPIKVITALLTYKAGHGVRGNNTWKPQQRVVDAVDSMFYMSFKNIIPTGKRILLGLDVSGSMTMGTVAGVIGFTPRIASAVMAMITMRTETNYEVCGFTDSFIRLKLSEKMRLDEVERYMNRLSFGGTDCALPMTWAAKNKVPVDGFAVYTDNETWAGHIHPSQALKKYRKEMSIPSKLVVVGLVANEFSIADPNDAGMMDVVGFDSAAPSLIADFFRGEF